MGALRHVAVELPAVTPSVATARRAVADLLADGPDSWRDPALLAVSEIVTNAVMHAGSSVSLAVWTTSAGLRVEVSDASTRLPVRREYSVTSGTGRGLHLLDSFADRWGCELREPGKVVWFELGEHVGPDPAPPGSGPGGPATDREVAVTLRRLPLLMHWAWQEHAQALLREYLLFALDIDPAVMAHHAESSDALALLFDQVPVPQLPDDPDALLDDAIEPGVTADEIVVRIPAASVPHFATLHSMLDRAVAAAARGTFLGPPTQPEMAEMRTWICEEVARQAEDGSVGPRPWAPETDARSLLVDEADLRARYRELAELDEAVLVTDEASVIVAVTPPALAFLGYSSESDLLGRRVLTVVPHRYHQAHIAGTTLNATNGRRVLLDVPITVPVVRADGSEAPVRLSVSPHRLDGRHRVFLAVFDLSATADE